MDENNTATPCKCYKTMVRNGHLKFANIPENYRDIKLDSFVGSYYTDKETLKAMTDNIKYWLSNVEQMTEQGIGLYLWSNTKGSGKTRMATSIANELIYKHDKVVKFVTSLDILAEIKATWNNDSDEFSSESQFIKYLTTTEILIIDDFGTEHHGNTQNWIDDKFYQIINTRYINRLATIFTSNYSIEKLKYDDRITNRIIERAYPIHFPEESVRTMIAAIRQQNLKEALSNGK